MDEDHGPVDARDKHRGELCGNGLITNQPAAIRVGRYCVLQQREVGRIAIDRHFELVSVENARLDDALKLQCLDPLPVDGAHAQRCSAAMNGQIRRVEVSAGQESGGRCLTVCKQRRLSKLAHVLRGNS